MNLVNILINYPRRQLEIRKLKEPTESRNTGPWLAENQSRDLDNELWLAVYLPEVEGSTSSPEGSPEMG